jgi:hypothetical protein
VTGRAAVEPDHERLIGGFFKFMTETGVLKKSLVPHVLRTSHQNQKRLMRWIGFRKDVREEMGG